MSSARSARRGLLAALILAAVGCGNGPTAPTLPESSLPRGTYWLHLVGFDLSDSAEFPPCSNIGVPRAGKRLDTLIVIDHEQGEVIGRSLSAADGTVLLRFRLAEALDVRTTVSGSVEGVARDSGREQGAPRDVYAQFAAAEGSGPALVEGDTRIFGANPAFYSGRIGGRVTFGNSEGASGDCSAVSWALFTVTEPRQ